MRRSLLARVLAVFLASTAALAAPSSALAHGETHHHAAEHHDVPADANVHADWSASAPDHGHEHHHPRLDGTTRTRANELAFIAAPPVVVPEADVIQVPAAIVRSDKPAGGDPSTGPPPRLRAPPTR